MNSGLGTSETIHGKAAPRATFQFEFFPQNAHTLHALENSIFNGILGCLLRFSDWDGLDLVS